MAEMAQNDTLARAASLRLFIEQLRNAQLVAEDEGYDDLVARIKKMAAAKQRQLTVLRRHLGEIADILA